MAKNTVKASILKTHHTAKGALYKGSKVIITDPPNNTQKIRVTDEIGRIFWVKREDVKID